MGTTKYTTGTPKMYLKNAGGAAGSEFPLNQDADNTVVQPGLVNAAGFTLGTMLSKLTVVRALDYDHENGEHSHWETYFSTSANISVKVDLLQSYYRVLYSAIKPGNAYADDYTLDPEKSLGEVLKAAVDVAKDKGKWNGDVEDGYNCQIFVIKLMKRLGMKEDAVGYKEKRIRARVDRMKRYMETH
ncbi:hypothetical protein [Paraburkholderia pallida]|uniref:Uncharacterized protein n=1 Tax=Paraburkholderia pallida TaxID=2547399 RepID=A0A4P7CXG5_9BURK|nr:hypothetical protein [Paraburkholderia pallida]QBQ98894.1 hypothetical protein E1956_16695 [Paraburkholderia pallida]